MKKIFFCGPAVFRRESFFGRLVVKLSAADAVRRGETGNAGLRAYGQVSHLEIPAYFIDGLLYIFSIRVAVNQNAVPTFTAEKVVDGGVQRFAFDVPECRIDSGNRGHCYGPATPICPAIQILPNVFRLKWIASDETRYDTFFK